MQRNPIFEAIQLNKFGLIRQIVQANAKVVSSRDEHGKSPLQLAVSKGFLPTVLYLIENGADMEAKDYYGMCALGTAVTCGSVPMTKLLLKFGANPETICANDNFLIHLACSQPNVELVTLLLDHGVNINTTTLGINRTPLHIATIAGHLDIVELLLHRYASMTITDVYGRIPFCYAAYNDYYFIAWELLQSQFPHHNKDTIMEMIHYIIDHLETLPVMYSFYELAFDTMQHVLDGSVMISTLLAVVIPFSSLLPVVETILQQCSDNTTSSCWSGRYLLATYAHDYIHYFHSLLLLIDLQSISSYALDMRIVIGCLDLFIYFVFTFIFILFVNTCVALCIVVGLLAITEMLFVSFLVTKCLLAMIVLGCYILYTYIKKKVIAYVLPPSRCFSSRCWLLLLFDQKTNHQKLQHVKKQ